LGQEVDVGRLHEAAVRLAAGLDEAGLCLGAAYVSMAVDAIEGSAAFRQGREVRSDSPRQDEGMLNGVPFDTARGVAQDRLRQAQDDPSTGSGRAGRSGGIGLPDAIDLDFTLDEQGRVWMIREGDCYVLGPTEAVCGEMRRFLAGVGAGGDGYT
jgi:hypothetical protein